MSMIEEWLQQVPSEIDGMGERERQGECTLDDGTQGGCGHVSDSRPWS